MDAEQAPEFAAIGSSRAGAARADRCGAGETAREHRVVDAFAGQRIDQGCGVTHEQHSAVGLARTEGRQRQVVGAQGCLVGRLVWEQRGQRSDERSTLGGC